MRQVFDTKGVAFTLGDKIAAGGQGEVFPMVSLPGRVVKIFLPKFLTGEEGKNLRGKLAALRDKQLCATLPEVAWPEFSVFDSSKQCIGYAMRRVDGVSLADNVLAPLTLIKQGSIDRLVLAGTAISFLETLQALHAEDVWVGDFNPGNFLFEMGQGKINFIDADSYQVAAGGSAYVCRMTSPGMTSPEYLNIQVIRQWRSPESELFSGAIIVFMILMPGKHPFDAKGVNDYQEGLAKGSFAYRPAGEPPTGLIPDGIWETVWDELPLSLQEAFTAIFFRGHQDPVQRGSLDDLLDAVTEYRDCLSRGAANVDIDVRKWTPKHPGAAGGMGTAAAPGTAGTAPTNIAGPSLWQQAKPQSRWGRVLWWLVG